MRTRLVPYAVRLALTSLAAALLLLVSPHVARAADGPQRVAIYVQGTDAKTVSKEIAALIPAGVEVEQSAFGRSLEERGFVRDPKFDTSKKLGERVAKALKASHADVAVVVRVNKKRLAHVLVFRRGEPAPEVDETIALGKKSGSDAEKAALKGTLSGALPSPPAAAKAAKEEPSKEEAEEADAEEEASPEETGAAPVTASEKPSEEAAPEPEPSHADELPAFMLGLSLGIAGRDFEFKRRVTPNLRPYSVWGIALSELELEAYPFAKSPGALKNFGLLGSFLIALPFRTEVEDVSGAKPKSYYQQVDVGLRYRIPFARRSALLISATFDGQDFTFSDAGALASTVPSVRYRSLEPALGAKIAAGPVVVLVAAGYRFVLSGGKVLNRFPRASVGALDLELGAALPLGAGPWALRLLTRYERYFYTMNANSDDPYVAGGALDQYFTALAGLSYGF